MPTDQVEELYALLSALFRSEEELQRFLALERVNLSSSLQLSQRRQSKSATAYEVAQALVEQNLATHDFFAALERRAPERRADIVTVAESFVTAKSVPTAPRLGSPQGGRYAGFAARLTSALVALAPSDDVDRAQQAERWPWAAAASVLGRFDPLVLRPMEGPSTPAGQVTPGAVEALADLVTASHDGSWVLRDQARKACLARINRSGAFRQALEANQNLTDVRRDLLRQVLAGTPPRLPWLSSRELTDLDAVLSWLEGIVEVTGVSREDVHALADRRLVIDPLRTLVGRHFRGRRDELASLVKHVAGRGTEELLTIRGAGGAGKSSLLGKIVLELEDQLSERPISFAYIDFDRSQHDPRNPRELLRQIAHQLRLMYATSELSAQFAALESVYAGTDLPSAAELLDIDGDLDPEQFLDLLCLQLLEVREGFTDSDTPPLVLVLDTCEEVLCKGPGAVNDLNVLLAGLYHRLPDLRVVAAGRSLLPVFDGRVAIRRIELKDLDRSAADAVLQYFGVEDTDLRVLIMDSFGGNPLTLRLAAEALQRSGSAETAFAGVLPRTRALATVASEQVQGMLYSRILGHIDDLDVVAVAHPGLAVRRVTVEVLSEVLAAPCGFDPKRSAEIFGKLESQLTLFDLEQDGSLRHRQDVRRVMLRSILDDGTRAEKVSEIHRRAVAYYDGRPDPVSRAEALYHRLMSGQDVRQLDHLWNSSLASLLGSALEEPLPPASDRWLRRRIRTDKAPDFSAWEQEDWEANAHARAESWLLSGDPWQALAVLAERPARLSPSRLPALEVAALIQVGDLNRASEILQQGLTGNDKAPDRAIALELAEQALSLHGHRGEADGVVEAAFTCTTLSDLTGEPARGLRALVAAVNILEKLATDSGTVRTELAQRFARMSRSDLLQDPELTKQVLHAGQSADPSLVTHAALSVGDQTSEDGGVFVEDTFTLSRLLDNTVQTAAAASMSLLASSVGLVDPGWTIRDLASAAVRTGRTGEAVALSLDFAENKSASLDLVVTQLVQPLTEPTG